MHHVFTLDNYSLEWTFLLGPYLFNPFLPGPCKAPWPTPTPSSPGRIDKLHTDRLKTWATVTTLSDMAQAERKRQKKKQEEMMSGKNVNGLELWGGQQLLTSRFDESSPIRRFIRAPLGTGWGVCGPGDKHLAFVHDDLVEHVLYDGPQ